MAREIALEYNAAQLAAHLAPQKTKVLLWGRGTGKSTYAGGHIDNVVRQLPRSTNIIVGETYQQILTRTLPSTINGLEKHGLYKGVHYFVGKRPPKRWDWPEAYQPPISYDHYMTFYNGCGFHFVSQDRPGSGRGLNASSIMGDESALLDKNKLDTDVILSTRGTKNFKAVYPDGTWKYFHECAMHMSQLYMSSMPLTTKGMWLLEMVEKAVAEPDKICAILASAQINAHNLEPEWFENLKRTLPDFIYNAEVLNKPVIRVQDGFYPALDEDKHTYTAFLSDQYPNLDSYTFKNDSRKDGDVNTDSPLVGGVDWGSRINCMVVGQHDRSENVFRFLKNLYVLAPKTLDDLAEEFCKYYRYHENKRIYLWYDNTGNNRQANSQLTYAQQFAAVLKRHGWTVHLMTKGGSNVEHQKKFLLWVTILKEDTESVVRVQINRDNCPELIISMLNAPAKQGRTEAITKDKSSERRKGDQQHATHFSDTADTIIFGMFNQQIGRRHKVRGPQVVQ